MNPLWNIHPVVDPPNNKLWSEAFISQKNQMIDICLFVRGLSVQEMIGDIKIDI